MTSRIHVVCPETKPTRILHRLAAALTVDTGWTLGPQPRSNVDLNYLVPYLVACQPPFAAYFSHREWMLPAKARLWWTRAKQASLRIVTAAMYAEELTPYGPTQQIIPPLDREKFQPLARARHTRPVAGTTGWVYAGGRKGEALLADIIKTKAGQHFDWRASGSGWPVPTQLFPYETLHEFYQELDVYVCTSLVEGVPYGPLEALACGVPVVIPRGVGLLDELPDWQGLVRYTAGDVTDLEHALEMILQLSRVDRDGLRSLTEPFTLKGWVENHVQVLDPAVAYKPLSNPSPVIIGAPRRSDAGIYVVAHGKNARLCAQRLLDSIRRYSPALPVALVSDAPLGGEDIFIADPNIDGHGRDAKLRAYALAPARWKYVLYLDADTELRGDVTPLVAALEDGWEMVLCTEIVQRQTLPFLHRRSAGGIRVDNTTEIENLVAQVGTDKALSFSGGVWSFRRCPAAKALLAAWHAGWKAAWKDAQTQNINVKFEAGRATDQPAFSAAIYSHPVRAFYVTNNWNAMMKYPTPRGGIMVAHHAAEARPNGRPKVSLARRRRMSTGRGWVWETI